jgi:prepilin-type N-terminal cleavage/methylation domain-containing protein/prepilin-type processing-associated H-X9-DG protein
MKHCVRRPKGFTLVELLVVIGIIAALIGILLPVLSGVQARGRDLKCQSNLRQLVQAVFGYCAENKGCMPWGFVWNKSNNQNSDPWSTANDWDQTGDNPNNEYISNFGLLGKYMNSRVSGIDADGIVGSELRMTFGPVMQCPEAAQVREHAVGYVMNMIVTVSPYYELQIPNARQRRTAQLRPPPQTMMGKETALIWDTAIRPNWQDITGHLVGADIDGQERMWFGAATPQWRYLGPDVYAQLAGGVFGHSRPIALGWSGRTFYNKDPDTSANERWPYQGNIRFRHNKNTSCNVGFSDGSVRRFTAKMNGDNTVQKHDAIRRFFMIKWPSGTPRDTTTP